MTNPLDDKEPSEDLMCAEDVVFPLEKKQKGNDMKSLSMPEQSSCDQMKDVADTNGISGVCGLYNLGNTCFMNACLQCLYATDCLRVLFFSLMDKLLMNNAQLSDEQKMFVSRLHDIFLKIKHGSYSSLYTGKFHASIAKIHPVFADFKQHDCQEFLIFVLSIIDEWTHVVAEKYEMDCLGETHADVMESEKLRSSAENAWCKHLRNQQSAVTDNMQGQIQSSTECSTCHFKSFAFEPFTFLSLPIPHGMEVDIVITWVPSSTAINSLPGIIMQYMVTVSKNSRLGDVRKEFLKLLMMENTQVNPNNILLAEVSSSAFVNILDDRTLVTYVNSKKDICAIEVVHHRALHAEDEMDCRKTSTWHTCSICLEEKFDEDLNIHATCGGLMCDDCLQSMGEFHDQKLFACPVCNRFISVQTYESFQVSGEKKPIREMYVPLLFRKTKTRHLDKMNVFGYPTICCLLTTSPSQAIHAIVQQLLTSPQEYNVLITGNDGHSCGLCQSGCHGCVVDDNDSLLQLKPGCCITVHFYSNHVKHEVLRHTSMSKMRLVDYVTMDECLHKYAERENILWFCPHCKCNQEAIKTMKVTRWPNILFIHLKRFHFENSVGSKILEPVSFPLSNLNVDMLSTDSNPLLYNLYALVCHRGSLYGGHYTSFAKSHEVWYHFNDETYNEATPGCDQWSEVYVLCYERKTSKSIIKS